MRHRNGFSNQREIGGTLRHAPTTYVVVWCVCVGCCVDLFCTSVNHWLLRLWSCWVETVPAASSAASSASSMAEEKSASSSSASSSATSAPPATSDSSQPSGHSVPARKSQKRKRDPPPGSAVSSPPSPAYATVMEENRTPRPIKVTQYKHSSSLNTPTHSLTYLTSFTLLSLSPSLTRPECNIYFCVLARCNGL